MTRLAYKGRFLFLAILVSVGIWILAIFGIAHANAGDFIQDPPMRFRDCDINVRLVITSAQNAEFLCTRARGTPSSSCTIDTPEPEIIMPDMGSEALDHWVRRLRHEVGHACKWPADHPE